MEMSEKSTVKSHSYAPFLLFSSLVLFFLGSLVLWSIQSRDMILQGDFDPFAWIHMDDLQKHDRTQSLERRGNNPLDSTAIKVVIGVGVFAVINVFVITVHHIVQKVSRASNLYRSIDHVISPF